MTTKQKLFIKKYLETGNGTQAALEVYNTNDPNVAKVIASENLTKPNIREALEVALSSQGLTLDVIAGNIGNLANSKPEKVSSDAILKANVELLKLHGAYPDKKSYQFSVSARADIRSMTFQEAKMALEKLNRNIDELLTEV
ncbi:hypothetical protein C4577_00360 [Candidatus Parcubacteria bacterium]|nr:MAG: hypothetical protein C4577_00360 [Candidatus Parcubacteria bacterium]